MLIASPLATEAGYPHRTFAMKREIYLDGPAIPFTVGTDLYEPKYFYVPLSVLAEYSIFFHELHSHCSLDDPEALKFDVDTDPKTFNRFTIWLYYQGIYVDESISEPLDYYEQFESLWTLADKYRVPQLQKQAADIAILLLKNMVEQYDFDVLAYWQNVYHNSHVGSPQRRFIAGQCAFLLTTGQEKFLDPEVIHPALRGDIQNILYTMYAY